MSKKNYNTSNSENIENVTKALRYTRNLIEVSLDAFVTMGADGFITDVNTATERATGIPRSKLINTAFAKYFTDPKKAELGYQKAFKDDRIYNYELELKHLNGTISPVLFNAAVYKNDDNEVIGLFAVARDITKIRKFEKELINLKEILEDSNIAINESLKYNRSLIEASLDPFVTMSADGLITDVNRATERVTGLDRERLINTAFSDYFTNPIKAKTGYEQAFRDEKIYNYELELKHVDGSTIPVLFNAAVYKNDQNEVVGLFAAARDITIRKMFENEFNTLNDNLEEKIIQAVETLNHSRKLMKYTIDHTKSGISVHDKDLNFLYVSKSYLKQNNLNEKDIIGKHPYDIFPFFPQKWKDVNKRTLLGEVFSEDKDSYIDDSGAKQWTRWESRPWFEKDGKIGGIIVYTENITEEVKLLEELKSSEESLKQAQTIGKIGSWELIIDNNLIWASQEAYSIFEIERTDGNISKSKIQDMVAEEDKEATDKALYDLINNQKPYNIEYKIYTGTGKVKYLDSSALLIYDKNNIPLKVIGVFHDITNLKEKEIELEYLAYNDFLTGLYNRRYYEENLKLLDIEENYPMTIIMADINGLKLVNDAFGHSAGDNLLISAANIMLDSCKENSLVARIGGDEFVIVLPNTDTNETEKIIRDINNNIAEIKIETIQLSISFGYSTKHDKLENIQEVFRSAEDAMYREKLIEIPSMRSGAIETILTTLYEKDESSEIHSRSVSNISERLAKAYGLDRQEVLEVKTAGLLHDIGKIIISEAILKKEGKLTTDEYEIMKSHSEIGFRILNSTSDMRSISNIVLNHHERCNGTGYPRGIKSKDIPLKSRIISIADAFDAMTSKRTYKEIISKEEALQELIDCAGTQFDAKLVEVFRENFNKITAN